MFIFTSVFSTVQLLDLVKMLATSSTMDTAHEQADPVGFANTLHTLKTPTQILVVTE